MDARELRALIEEQPFEAERIIKRDKRSSYFRYLKEFLGMPMDFDAPAPGGPNPVAANPPTHHKRAGGVKRPAPSSGASTTSSQPLSISVSASSASASSRASSHAPSSLHHPAAPAPALGPSFSSATAGSSISGGALLLLEEEEKGAPACWSAAVRSEYLAWLQEPAARGGWGLVGGPDEAVGYVRTGHVLIRKVLSDALGRADYQVRREGDVGVWVPGWTD